MIKQLIMLLCIASIHSSSAQTGSALFQVDGSLYAAGETVYGTIYFLGINANAKVLKIEMVDVESNVIESFFSKVENDHIDFSIDLPYNSSTASYQIRATTIDNFNNTIEIGGLSIFCLSNIEDFIQPILPSFNSSELISMTKDNLFDVGASSNSELVLKPKRPDKILSVSIADNEWEASPNVIFYKNKFEQKEINNWANKIFFQGNLDRKNQPIEWNIIGLYDNQEDRFILSKSDKAGKFTYLLDDFEDIKYFQIVPYGSDAKSITLRKVKNYPIYGSLIQRKFTEKEIVAFDAYKLKNRIGQYFNVLTFEKKNNVKERIENLTNFQKNYFPGNFKKFEYFHQFCKENNAALQFKEKDKMFKAQVDVPAVYAKKFNVTAQNPLFVVNGIVTTNYDIIARIKTKEIDSFEEYLEPEDLRKAYSIFGAQTVIKMKTKSDLSFLSETEKRNTVELKGFKKVSKRAQEKIQEKKAKNLKPIFEAHLFFAANREELHIFKSDDKAKYNIITIVQKSGEEIEILTQELDFKQ